MTRPASTERPPFQRPMQAGRLGRDAETRFRIAAEPGERAAIARFLDVDAVERLSFAGFVAPYGRDGYRVHGRLVAKIVQTCVVTLEPVRTRVEEEIERVYLPANQIPRHPEVVLLHDEEDAPDPFTDTIDPGELAVESLSLLIDPYPRSERAALERDTNGGAPEQGVERDTIRPFAGLAEMMRRSGPGKG